MIEELKQKISLDYRKHATREIGLFSSSIFGEVYVKSVIDGINLGFSSIVWITRDRSRTTFYRSQKDHENSCKQLGEKLLNRKYALFIASELIRYTDWIYDFIKNNKITSNKKLFVDKYREFFALHQGVYWGGDYLAAHYSELKENIVALNHAYDYNQMVVPDVENWLVQQGVDYLRYDQEEGKIKDTGLFFFPEQTLVLTGKELDEIENYICSLNQIDVNVSELKGVGISKEKVQGIVQVIKDPNRLGEVKEGVILVTGNSRPQFHHLIRKCKGIVTNEGNMLAHAAILSRECGLPCLMSTRIATEVFKDGDLVEMDCDLGIVRKL